MELLDVEESAEIPWWVSGTEATSNAGDMGSVPEWGRSPGKEMATYSSVLAWEIPWTEEPDGLQSVGP